MRYPPGFRIDEHVHGWSQVVYAARGVLAVEAQGRRWVVPPHRALWVPAGVGHALTIHEETWLRTAYLRREYPHGPGDAVRVLQVGGLMREVILEIVRIGSLEVRCPLHRSLATVLAAELASAPDYGTGLPSPRDPRAAKAAQEVLARLDDPQPLATFARHAGAAARTLDRLFREETGLSFGQWRQQARLQHALLLLAKGRDVGFVASACGYSSASAFGATFRRAFGKTPGQHQKEHGDGS